MFSPNSVKPQTNRPARTSATAGRRRPNVDILGKVLRVDPSETGTGVVYLVEDDPKLPHYRFFKGVVRKSFFDYKEEGKQSRESKNQDQYDVWVINEKIRSVILDKWVVLENTSYASNSKNEEVPKELLDKVKDPNRIPEKPVFYSVEIDTVAFLKNYSVKKCGRAIMTGSSYNNKMNNVQMWQDKSVRVFDYSESEGGFVETPEFLELIKTMDRAYNEHQGAFLGGQFRLLYPARIKWGEEQDGYRVISTVLPSHSTVKPEDAGENYNNRLSGEALSKIASEYLGQYLYSGDYVVPEGVDLDKCIIEYAPYRSYLTSAKGNNYKFNIVNKSNSITPQMRMCNYSSFCEPNQTEPPYVGSNWAVQGIFSLSNDKENEDGEKIKLEILNNVFLHGFAGHVQNLVLASDGKRCIIDDVLKGSEYFPQPQAKDQGKAKAEEAKEAEASSQFDDEVPY